MRRLLLIFAFAASASAAELPKYWSVHIDKVNSDDRDDYEKAGREQAVVRRQILADHKIENPAQFAIRTSDGMYLGFRPRENFAAFDSTLPAEVRDEMQKRAGAIDDRVHATLRNHHSEIWETRDDLSVIPENAMKARGYARLATMRVKPSSVDDFAEVMKRFAEALRKTSSNDVLLTFFSTYGDGAFKQLWLSNDQIIGMKDTFREAFDEDQAEELMKRWKVAIDAVHISPARARPDLTASSPETWLQY